MWWGIVCFLSLVCSPGEVMAMEQRDAVFAGGCFWCLEGSFDQLPGVVETQVGYTGGSMPSPSYKDVSSGNSGHVEAIKVVYDSEKIRYEELLRVFWRNIDPLDGSGQFCDRGPQYTSAIFVANAEEEHIVQSSMTELEASGTLPGKIQTKILPRTQFYAAEEYHQDYYKKNPIRYHFYRQSCGRGQRLNQLWPEQISKD